MKPVRHYLSDLLVDEFNAAGIEHTVENYTAFVQDFARANNMTITGTDMGSGWSTKDYQFDTPADELFFTLKYEQINRLKARGALYDI